MKLPKLPKIFQFKPLKRLNATTIVRRAAPPVDDYNEEPQTKLSSAFVVVLILHLVAVGGIYAFNSIKAHRKALEPALASVPSKPVLPQAAPSMKAETPSLQVAPLTANPQAATNLTPISQGRVHHVKSGETTAKIATQYGVHVSDLEEVNGAKNIATLRVGQVLNIPKPKPAATAAKTEAPKVNAAAKTTAPKTYAVAKGDNLVGIAKKLGVSNEELVKLNGIDDPKKLQIGQLLKVPAKKAN